MRLYITFATLSMSYGTFFCKWFLVYKLNGWVLNKNATFRIDVPLSATSHIYSRTHIHFFANFSIYLSYLHSLLLSLSLSIVLLLFHINFTLKHDKSIKNNKMYGFSCLHFIENAANMAKRCATHIKVDGVWKKYDN